jgi:hypothetical protein
MVSGLPKAGPLHLELGCTKESVDPLVVTSLFLLHFSKPVPLGLAGFELVSLFNSTHLPQEAGIGSRGH